MPESLPLQTTPVFLFLPRRRPLVSISLRKNDLVRPTKRRSSVQRPPLPTFPFAVRTSRNAEKQNNENARRRRFHHREGWQPRADPRVAEAPVRERRGCGRGHCPVGGPPQGTGSRFRNIFWRAGDWGTDADREQTLYAATQISSQINGVQKQIGARKKVCLTVLARR